VDRLAQRFFSKAETAAVCATPGPRKTAAFLTCWTRKEAYLKAVGVGLDVALDSFEVSVGPEKRARLLTVDGSRWAARPWTMLDVPPVDGAVGALAVRLTQPGAVFYEWHLHLHTALMRLPAASL
jgi:4'-phosphopantetheinyl transferase